MEIPHCGCTYRFVEMVEQNKVIFAQDSRIRIWSTMSYEADIRAAACFLVAPTFGNVHQGSKQLTARPNLRPSEGMGVAEGR